MNTRLMSVKDISERYGCSEKTARRYMRQMVHMERPLMVTDKAVEAWEIGRTYNPVSGPTPSVRGRRSPAHGRYLISRTREG